MILALTLGIINIIFGLNEATLDILDQIGSNYWLAYSAILSGIVVIAMVLFIFKRSSRTPTDKL